MTKPQIQVDPQAALTDVPLAIRLAGFGARQRVTVRARTHGDDLGRDWEAYAVFETGADGTADLGSQAPLEGAYRQADPMGLIHALQLDPAAEEECYFLKRTLTPLRITFDAEVDGRTIATAVAERQFLAPGTVRSAVREAGLVGTFFRQADPSPRPADPSPRPGIIVLGGGDGGVLEHGAALLASRGYAALALGYFNAEGLPPQPIEIPLEYFGRAIGWLQARPEVDARRIALSGTSLGAMYALLAAAAYPEVRAVVCYALMGIVTGQGPENRAPVSFEGRPLPFLSLALTAEEEKLLEQKLQAREPVSIKPVILRLLEDEAALAPAEIPVEKINCPILLVTGADDQAIPSPRFAERIMARLDRHGFPHAHHHLSYPGAGHAIGLPHCHGLPYVPNYGRPPAQGMLWNIGGNTRDDARANVDSWQQVLRFLAESV